ncbi:MAG: AAA family ATPase, partial [Thiomargarita sp.]|nr:AAA family ATPase [Thiomargarita sp.]
MLKFPYGFSDFYLLRMENYFYVDRTSHIRLIEEAGHQLLFLRPRRFGKSLLLSMLENYYDVAKASEFEKLFGDLAIGQNPTPKHNQYLVMKWDFSMIEPQDEIKGLRKSLHDHLNNQIKRFAERYQDYFSYRIKIDEENAISSFESALIAVQTTEYKLYLLIDEYDNFANEVMMGRGEINPKRYKALLSADSSL